jgi:hypothetical protein
MAWCLFKAQGQLYLYLYISKEATTAEKFVLEDNTKMDRRRIGCKGLRER